MYSTCKELFTGICDELRAKEGSAGLIQHQDIPARIRNLSVGGHGIEFISHETMPVTLTLIDTENITAVEEETT